MLRLEPDTVLEGYKQYRESQKEKIQIIGGVIMILSVAAFLVLLLGMKSFSILPLMSGASGLLMLLTGQGWGSSDTANYANEVRSQVGPRADSIFDLKESDEVPDLQPSDQLFCRDEITSDDTVGFSRIDTGKMSVEATDPRTDDYHNVFFRIRRPVKGSLYLLKEVKQPVKKAKKRAAQQADDNPFANLDS